MEGGLAIVGSLSLVAFFIFMYFSSRHKERMALIESGSDAKLFRSTPQRYVALKWGLLLLFFGIGIGIGVFMDFRLNNDGPFATIPISLIAGGLGLLVYYNVVREHDED